jgi:hypothetical protein
MNPEQLESLPREERIKLEVEELLGKAKQRLELAKGLERSERSNRDIRGNLQESKLERIEHGHANELEVASHRNLTRGSEFLTTMIEQLQAAQEAIQEGRTTVDPFTKVSDVLEAQQKIWRKEFEAPENN